MKKAGAYVIRREQQLAALRSACRQEIVDVLAEMGEVSAQELASALGRPPDALYFHLRALAKAGLVCGAGYRYRGSRKEALFRTVSPELRLQYEPQREANREGVVAIVDSMLRLTARDFKRAFQLPEVVVSGEARELWALRKAGRLTKAQVGSANRAINKLVGAISHSSRSGRLYAITVLLTPIERRRATQNRKGSKR
jgi:DNA-binding transcriptional ArsR family regulator